jgi:hypothetical protein
MNKMFGRFAFAFLAIGSPAGDSALAKQQQKLEQIMAIGSRAASTECSQRAEVNWNDLIIDNMTDK